MEEELRARTGSPGQGQSLFPKADLRSAGNTGLLGANPHPGSP